MVCTSSRYILHDHETLLGIGTLVNKLLSRLYLKSICIVAKYEVVETLYH